MNIHDATEVAYKNGYKAGVKEFKEKLKTETFLAKEKGSVEHTLWIDEIDDVAKKLVGDKDGR